MPTYSEHRQRGRRPRALVAAHPGAVAQALRLDQAVGPPPPTAAGPSDARAAIAITDIH